MQLHSQAFGVTTPTNERALPWDTVTLASALKHAGYDTCLVGKWHIGSKPQWGPNHYGFDHSYGSLAGGVTPWSHFYKKGPYSVTWHRNGELLEENGHVTDLLTDEAVKWIGTRRDAPFFLYVPFTAVHLPLNEPEHWLAKVPASITSEPLLLDAAKLPERPIYIAGPRWRARSLRLGHWKLVVTGKGDNRALELFDIGADPEEVINLASQHPQRLQAMLKQLVQGALRHYDLPDLEMLAGKDRVRIEESVDVLGMVSDD